MNSLDDLCQCVQELKSEVNGGRLEVALIARKVDELSEALTGPRNPKRDDPPGLIHSVINLERAVNGDNQRPGLVDRVSSLEISRTESKTRIATAVTFGSIAGSTLAWLAHFIWPKH